MMRKKWLMISILAIVLLFGGVSDAYAQSFKQWPIRASASSSYGTQYWSAQQLIGEPNVYPNYGDVEKAWAPAARNDGLQWIELGFAEAVYVEYVEIYETFNPGAVVKVELIDETGASHLIWQGTAQAAPQVSRILTIENQRVDVPARQVRIELQTDKVLGWNEIDTVGLIGTRTATQASVATDPLAQLASVTRRLEEAISQAKADRSADFDFLQELDQILKDLSSIGF